ncbi:MAG: preprotein translocase subunit SecY [Rickettsiaceae bacterium]|nr:preprotein translocase subunit SecY [Rickettsiaceae bacterium]
MNYKKETSSYQDLQSRILFTLLVLLVCRVGSFIPIAGIDAVAMTNFAQQNQTGILGIFNVLSGGSLARMSVFALAVMPYITASIIIQLLTMAFKPLEELKKEGEIGRKKINQYTRTLTVFLASTHAFGIATGLIRMSSEAMPIVVIDHNFFLLSAVTSLVVGTMLLMWLGEQISARGIGNGSSLIIFVGIVSGIPSAIISTFELARKGSISSFTVISIIFLIAAMITMIVFFERAQRKVLVQYPKRQVGNKIYGGDSSYIPLKLNTAGVIPPIFANSVLLFPLTIANLASNKDSGFLQEIAIHLNRGKPLYIILSAVLIVFFTFFYTIAVFNSEETANNLRKHGAYIPGRRPGAHTSEYFDYLLTRITVLGAFYICTICLIPEIIAIKVPLTFALGGTSMLIVVNVILDTISVMQTYLFSSRYENIMKKVKIR